MAPETGFHSVIDRPDSVRRVMPPTTTIAKTSAATASSQLAIALGRGRVIAGAYAADWLGIQQLFATTGQCDVVSFNMTCHYIMTKGNRTC